MIRYLNVKSRSRNELIDITKRVEELLAESGMKNGVCYIYVPHTTAGITINEGADPSVQKDILNTLSKLVPHEGGYRHMEGNADAHIKSTLVGAAEHVLIDEGQLVLGTWQAIFFCEFDGPRHRRVALRFISGERNG
ncbi:MAG: secondary thiamine-phosphate synthase enzyme YjbQ [Nitrospirota bacterium]|jgi:secondary thiamine-phosphate synthase enzyme